MATNTPQSPSGAAVVPRGIRPRQGAIIRSPGEIMAQFNEKLRRSLAGVGMVAATWGISTPIERAESPEQIEEQTVAALDKQRVERGGAAFDSPTATPPDQTYKAKRYDFLKESEGIRRFSYDDGKGFRTVGLGFNMDREDAKEVFEAATGLPEREFNAVYNGDKPLTETQIRQLFDFNATEAEKIVASRLGDVPLRQHQRLALVSMAYNSPALIGPKITEAIRNGNTDAAIHEILFNSDASLEGLARRRWKEATLFSGDASRLPPLKDYLAQVGS